MNCKTRAIIFLVCAAFLFGLLIGLFLTIRTPVGGPDDLYAGLDRLTGTELRYMMNESKWSPGQAYAYAQTHPDFAWLFDGSFVTYIYD